MDRESVDVRPLIIDSPLRLGLLQEERPGIIVADTSDMTTVVEGLELQIRVK